MTYDFAMEKRDFGRIDKLNKLITVETFFSDVRKLTKNVMSDHAIHRWECLSDLRWAEINGKLDEYLHGDFSGL